LRDELAKDSAFLERNMADICASLQSALIRMLIDKVKLAAEQTGITRIAVAGGVSANSGLRTALTSLGVQKGWEIFVPDFQYCTDNAAMIGIAAYHKFLKSDFSTLDVTPLARMPF
jgi:N6-L-threonylcarbamoyladenine synthase